MHMRATHRSATTNSGVHGAESTHERNVAHVRLGDKKNVGIGTMGIRTDGESETEIPLHEYWRLSIPELFDLRRCIRCESDFPV
jgi:hypothetical protein